MVLKSLRIIVINRSSTRLLSKYLGLCSPLFGGAPHTRIPTYDCRCAASPPPYLLKPLRIHWPIYLYQFSQL
jgi:hypothetical protein